MTNNTLVTNIFFKLQIQLNKNMYIINVSVICILFLINLVGACQNDALSEIKTDIDVTLGNVVIYLYIFLN